MAGVGAVQFNALLCKFLCMAIVAAAAALTVAEAGAATATTEGLHIVIICLVSCLPSDHLCLLRRVHFAKLGRVKLFVAL